MVQTYKWDIGGGKGVSDPSFVYNLYWSINLDLFSKIFDCYRGLFTQSFPAGVGNRFCRDDWSIFIEI